MVTTGDVVAGLGPARRGVAPSPHAHFERKYIHANASRRREVAERNSGKDDSELAVSGASTSYNCDPERSEDHNPG